jgi:hypothetical protein
MIRKVMVRCLLVLRPCHFSLTASHGHASLSRVPAESAQRPFDGSIAPGGFSGAVETTAAYTVALLGFPRILRWWLQ